MSHWMAGVRVLRDTYRLPAWLASEIAIIGPSGERMAWAIINLADRKTEGKVFVQSTL